MHDESRDDLALYQHNLNKREENIEYWEDYHFHQTCYHDQPWDTSDHEASCWSFNYLPYDNPCYASHRTVVHVIVNEI
jgi:hypothetical protein